MAAGRGTDSSRERTFALIGPGRLGLRLARRLVRAGWECAAVRGRRPALDELRRLLPQQVRWDTWSRPATWQLPAVVFICVGDQNIAQVAAQLADERAKDGTPFDTVVLHTSGLMTSSELAACHRQGAATASWHPLQTFPPVSSGPVEWTGVPCAIEGAAEAVATGFAIARQLGLQPWRIARQDKTLYHAAAVIGGNLTHILVVAARRLMASCVTDATTPTPNLAPLLLRSIRNALNARGLEALTGPIARGDQGTIEEHLQVLPPDMVEAYRAVMALAGSLTDAPPGEP